MKEYYVSYSGGSTVLAENEEEACAIAMSKLDIFEINAYEVDENGEIGQ